MTGSEIIGEEELNQIRDLFDKDKVKTRDGDNT